MEMWFSELHTSNVKLSMRIEQQLCSVESDCQRIDVLVSDEFGKFLALDGEILFSEKDEFIYDEMVTHVPMAVHPDVKNVLIIGGADGGVAKELINYKTIERIDVVEPDETLAEVCREYFPELTCGLDDERVNVYIQDGLRFLRSKTDEYDLIINDATDPFGYTEGLFTKEFYGSCYKALKEDGIMVYQHGSPFYSEDKEECVKMHRKAYQAFPVSRVYQDIFQPVRQVTGFLVSHQRSIIRYSTLSPMNGKSLEYRQSIIQQTFIKVHLCFLSMLRICLRKRNVRKIYFA